MEKPLWHDDDQRANAVEGFRRPRRRIVLVCSGRGFRAGNPVGFVRRSMSIVIPASSWFPPLPETRLVYTLLEELDFGLWRWP